MHILHQHTPLTQGLVQMEGAPEVANHMERMQPASAPPARPQRPAAMAGALLKPSKPTPTLSAVLTSTIHVLMLRHNVHICVVG